MRVLVTGAAGFIGSNLVHFLCRERPSWKITALDLLTYAGNLKNIATLVDEGRVSPRVMSIGRLCQRVNL